MQRLNNNWFKIILPSLVVAVVVAYLFYYASTFHIISTNPSLQSVAEISPFIKVNFSKPLASQDLSLAANDNIISHYQVQGKVLTIVLNTPLQLRSRYTINIISVADKALTDKITSQRLTFSPVNINFDALPKDQQQAIVNSQDKYPAGSAQADPILSHLPHSTLDFSLAPVFTTGPNSKTQLTLKAVLTLDSADMSSPQASQAAVSQEEGEVQQYIQSLGLNPANYTIKYYY